MVPRNFTEVIISMNAKETKVFKETKLRNLKRKYAKIVQHADLNEEAIELKC